MVKEQVVSLLWILRRGQFGAGQSGRKQIIIDNGLGEKSWNGMARD